MSARGRSPSSRRSGAGSRRADGCVHVRRLLPIGHLEAQRLVEPDLVVDRPARQERDHALGGIHGRRIAPHTSATAARQSTWSAPSASRSWSRSSRTDHVAPRSRAAKYQLSTSPTPSGSMHAFRVAVTGPMCTEPPSRVYEPRKPLHPPNPVMRPSSANVAVTWADSRVTELTTPPRPLLIPVATQVVPTSPGAAAARKRSAVLPSASVSSSASSITAYPAVDSSAAVIARSTLSRGGIQAIRVIASDPSERLDPSRRYVALNRLQPVV